MESKLKKSNEGEITNKNIKADQHTQKEKSLKIEAISGVIQQFNNHIETILQDATNNQIQKAKLEYEQAKENHIKNYENYVNSKSKEKRAQFQLTPTEKSHMARITADYVAKRLLDDISHKMKTSPELKQILMDYFLSDEIADPEDPNQDLNQNPNQNQTEQNQNPNQDQH